MLPSAISRWEGNVNGHDSLQPCFHIEVLYSFSLYTLLECEHTVAQNWPIKTGGFDLVLTHILMVSTVGQGAIKANGFESQCRSLFEWNLCGFSPATPDLLPQSKDLCMRLN